MTDKIVGSAPLMAGFTLDKLEKSYTNWQKQLVTYFTYDIPELSEDHLMALSELAVILNNLPEDGLFDMSQAELEELFKGWAEEYAESAEVPFTFESVSGRTHTYSPAALWESSSGCEWEQSSEEGYTHGWDI